MVSEKIPVLILDGGLVCISCLTGIMPLRCCGSLIKSQGTTLEDKFHYTISSTPLWSARPIDKEPELIIGAHLAFLRAGARIVSTATYALLSYHVVYYSDIPNW
jgi:hypothetical protein